MEETLSEFAERFKAVQHKHSGTFVSKSLDITDGLSKSRFVEDVLTPDPANDGVGVTAQTKDRGEGRLPDPRGTNKRSDTRLALRFRRQNRKTFKNCVTPHKTTGDGPRNVRRDGFTRFLGLRHGAVLTTSGLDEREGKRRCRVELGSASR